MKAGVKWHRSALKTGAIDAPELEDLRLGKSYGKRGSKSTKVGWILHSGRSRTIENSLSLV